MEGYSAKVTYVSKEISAKDKIKLKDTSNAISLDALTQEQEKVLISPSYYAQVDVHNDHSEDKDYTKYIIVDIGGNKYSTGSTSFFTALREIMEDMAENAPGEEYQIEVFRKPSANYKGKTFITCSLV